MMKEWIAKPMSQVREWVRGQQVEQLVVELRVVEGISKYS
jgi:hypothetical protein